ncbi:MAG TPA: esterase-like activity of phytase family protein, partial [Polyangiaceae bacterium]|nr:esterase-like activity of phytase family protein [Polyangiaceae bacterium]
TAASALAMVIFACSGSSGSSGSTTSGGRAGSAGSAAAGQANGGQLTGGQTNGSQPSGGTSPGGNGSATGGVQPAGGTNSQPVGGTNSQPAGGTNSQPVGGTNSQPVGGTNSQPAGGTNSQPAGGTNSQPAGGTNSQQGGAGASSGGGIAGGGSSMAGSTSNCPSIPQLPIPGTDSITFLPGVEVTTLAGGEAAGLSDGDGSIAKFSNPVSVVRLTDGSLIVADYDSSRLRKVVPSTATVTTLFESPGFRYPYGLALLDSVLVVNTDANSEGKKLAESGTLWSVDISTTPATAIVLETGLGRPRSLLGLPNRQILVSNWTHQTIYRFDIDTKSTLLLGGLKACQGYADGPGASSLFNYPSGVVRRHSDGAYIIADAINSRIRVIDTSGNVSTLAGGDIAATIDGPASSAKFVRPRAIAIDDNDNIYVSDDLAHRIRRIDASGNVITIAGAGSTRNAFADGTGAVAQFAGQEGIAVSADGKKLYVADGTGGSDDATQQNFHRIRQITISAN